MAEADELRSETSPLLPKASKVSSKPRDSSQEDHPPTETNGTTDGSTKAHDEEQQDDGEDREVQYQGMPDVRKRLPYILPALAIGVRLHAHISRMRVV